ncbi:hypothetical protein D3C80_812540 [compost metagenome]
MAAPRIFQDAGVRQPRRQVALGLDPGLEVRQAGHDQHRHGQAVVAVETVVHQPARAEQHPADLPGVAHPVGGVGLVHLRHHRRVWEHGPVDEAPSRGEGVAARSQVGGPLGHGGGVEFSVQPLQPVALQFHGRRQVGRRGGQDDPRRALGMAGGVFQRQDGAEAVAHDRDPLHAPGAPQLLQIVDHQLQGIGVVPGPFRAAGAPLVQIDHAQMRLQRRPGEAREGLAALARPAVQEDHRRPLALPGDAIPEPHPVDDRLVLARRQIRARRLPRRRGRR